MLPALSWLLITYLVGSTPFAVVLSTLYGTSDTDVRTGGSGNPGATNVARLYGWGLGGAVLACDVGKGALPVVLARLLWPTWDPWFGAAVALAAFLGHIFPVYLEFRGGKGVATAAGGMLALAPLPTLAAAALWTGLLALTGRSSVAALGATFAMLGLAWWLSPEVLPLVALLAGAIAVTHTPNLRRLWRGEENRIVRPVRWSKAPRSGGAEALEEGPAGGLAGVSDGWGGEPHERDPSADG